MPAIKGAPARNFPHSHIDISMNNKLHMTLLLDFVFNATYEMLLIKS